MARKSINEADWDRVGNKPCIRCNSESNPADHLGNRCYIFFRGTEQGKTWAAQVAESRKSASLLALPGTTVSTGTLLMMTAQGLGDPELAQFGFECHGCDMIDGDSTLSVTELFAQ